jgi:hypothetical protein
MITGLKTLILTLLSNKSVWDRFDLEGAAVSKHARGQHRKDRVKAYVEAIRELYLIATVKYVTSRWANTIR